MNVKHKGQHSPALHSAIRIRPAKTGDAGRIASLSGQLGYPVTTRKMRECIAAVSRRKDQKIFVAETDGMVHGWLEVFLPRSVLNWGKAEVGALIVDSKRRGSGLGRKLLDAARRWSEEHKSQFIYLRSNVRRKDAHRFYVNAGYRIHKTQHVFQYLLDTKRKG
jgi:GNAT superfamily N-acetyltransferase